MRVAALLLLLVVVMSACTGSGGAPEPVPTLQPGPERSELVAAAGLDRCPPSSAAPTDGGLPDVTLPCLGDGPAVHLAGLRGPLVVNMWGAWCLPCRKEMPHFARVAHDLDGVVQFLGVDTEDRTDSALDFVAHVRPRLRYPSVVDEDKKVLIALRLASAVPSTVFVDAAGKVVKVSAGPYLDEESLRADVSRYLHVDAGSAP